MSKRRLDVGDGVGAGKMLKEDTGTYVLTILLLLELEHSCVFRARQCEARNQDESAHCSPLHTTILRPFSEEDHLARLGVSRQVP